MREQQTRRQKKRELAGNIFVEAAFVFPLALLLLSLILRTGFRLRSEFLACAAPVNAGEISAEHVETCLNWLRLIGVAKEVLH